MTLLDEVTSAVAPTDRANVYLRLYERQMSHYENTQGIEWKVNFGVWTLLAAATVWASQNAPLATSIPAWSWTIALMVIVVAHGLWLRLVHASEEDDKELWCQYRAEALGVVKALEAPKQDDCKNRTWLGELFWLASEVGVTAGMAYAVWLLLTNPPPACCP